MMIAALFASLLWTSVFAPPPGAALLMQQSCQRYGVPLRVAEAVMYQESRGNQFATRHNPDGTEDRGPWQINSATQQWLEKRYNHGRVINPYDWYQSTPMAIRYLGELFDVFGSWRKALEAYNGGPGAVERQAVVIQAVWYATAVLNRAEM